jgi:hypothetical protein
MPLVVSPYACDPNLPLQLNTVVYAFAGLLKSVWHAKENHSKIIVLTLTILLRCVLLFHLVPVRLFVGLFLNSLTFVRQTGTKAKQRNSHVFVEPHPCILAVFACFALTNQSITHKIVFWNYLLACPPPPSAPGGASYFTFII